MRELRMLHVRWSMQIRRIKRQKWHARMIDSGRSMSMLDVIGWSMSMLNISRRSKHPMLSRRSMNMLDGSRSKRPILTRRSMHI